MEITFELILQNIARVEAMISAIIEVIQRDYDIRLPSDFEDIYAKYLARVCPALGLQFTPNEATKNDGLKSRLHLVQKEDE